MASTKHATDSTADFSDVLNNYLGQLEEFRSLAPLLLKNDKIVVVKPNVALFRFNPL